MIISFPRTGGYQAPPTLGMSTKPNEIPLASMGGLIPGGGADQKAVEAHLAVQGAIR